MVIEILRGDHRLRGWGEGHEFSKQGWGVGGDHFLEQGWVAGCHEFFHVVWWGWGGHQFSWSYHVFCTQTLSNGAVLLKIMRLLNYQCIWEWLSSLPSRHLIYIHHHLSLFPYGKCAKPLVASLPNGCRYESGQTFTQRQLKWLPQRKLKQTTIRLSSFIIHYNNGKSLFTDSITKQKKTRHIYHLLQNSGWRWHSYKCY